MHRDAVLEGRLEFAEDDWLPLWVIAQDVEELLDIEDPKEMLDATVTLVKELLETRFARGRLAS